MAPHTDWNGMSRTLLAPLWLLFNFHHMTNAQTTVPPGCGQGLNELYFNLCDLKAVWGIVLQAITSAGIVASFILTIVLVASTPFIQDKKKKSMLGTQVFFLLGTLGLFGLVFDMVVKKDFSTCTSRMFLFGVLFAICFSCLWAHGVNLNYLVRKNNGPSGWWIFAIAVCLSLVEVIINTEWLIILLVRTTFPTNPCHTENKDFVMALIYVMFLIIAGFVTAWPALCGKYGHWRRHAIFILITLFMSAAIWIVWIIMYIYGNVKVGNPDKWDDPTLAIALVSNAWAFIFFYIIPELSQLTKQSMEQTFEEDLYPTRGVGYETILKEQTSQSMYVENKAFSMDEPTSAAKRPVSPYSGYNGQIRSSVYQPTEMALMNKGMPELPYDVIIPRATANTHPVASGTSTIRAEDAYAAQNRNRSNPAAKNTQAHSPYPQW